MARLYGFMANEKITEDQFVKMAEMLTKKDLTLSVGCLNGFIYDDFSKNSDFEANLKAIKNYFETNQALYLKDC